MLTPPDQAAFAPPRHVAIIMDGNGRWAERRGLPRIFGHRKGAQAVRQTVEAAPDLGIKWLTLFGFSSENWRRPPPEVAELMRLLRVYLKSELAELHEKGVRLRIIGERERLAPDIVEMIEAAEALTGRNDGLQLTVAISYGGRQEIVAAARRLARDAAEGRVDPSEITIEDLSCRLFLPDCPDPDLVIRTSGERRISNFLLWQIAYAELTFVDTLWPDFGRDDLIAALADYQKRDRRYGASVGGV